MGYLSIGKGFGWGGVCAYGYIQCSRFLLAAQDDTVSRESVPHAYLTSLKEETEEAFDELKEVMLFTRLFLSVSLSLEWFILLLIPCIPRCSLFRLTPGCSLASSHANILAF